MLEKTLTPPQPIVKQIRTSDLHPNPHNPRVLFDRAPLDDLKKSIARVGILVPLTVYWSKAKNHYVILDGQRRWICAQELKLRAIPVNQVAEPTLVQNIVTMFQIHKLREDWELMPTALKIEVLMNLLKENKDKALANFTGLDQAVVARCKKLLSYPKKYQDMMLDLDPEKRVKADFFIELYPVINDRLVSKMKWFRKSKFTERMLDKYQQRANGLKAVTDFRVMKQHITNARRAGKDKAISDRLQEFTDNDAVTLDHLAIKSASVATTARRLMREVTTLAQELQDLDAAEHYGEEKLWDALEKLAVVIRVKLNEADRRPK
jgi:ParB family chromosome partitioning protein